MPPEAHSSPGKLSTFHGHSIHWGVPALHSLNLHLELPHTALGLFVHGKALRTPMFCGWSVFCGVPAPQSCSVHPRVHPCTRDSVYPTSPLCIAGSQHPKACPCTRSRGCSVLWGVPAPQNCSMHPTVRPCTGGICTPCGRFVLWGVPAPQSHSVCAGRSVHPGVCPCTGKLRALHCHSVYWGSRHPRACPCNPEPLHALERSRALRGRSVLCGDPTLQSGSVHRRTPCNSEPQHPRACPCSPGPVRASADSVHHAAAPCMRGSLRPRAARAPQALYGN